MPGVREHGVLVELRARQGRVGAEHHVELAGPDELDALAAGGGFPRHLHVGLVGDELLQASTHDGVIDSLVLPWANAETMQVFLAEDAEVLGRVLAIQLVAQTPPQQFGSSLAVVREALLEERWGDAVLTWMEATGDVVDAYPDDVVWTEGDLDAAGAALEIRLSPAFQDLPTE